MLTWKRTVCSVEGNRHRSRLAIPLDLLAACLALFGSADPREPLPGLDTETTETLLSRGDLLAHLERESGIAVLPVPPL